MKHSTAYLAWLVEHTRTEWWHDSADPAELDVGLARGAVGVTTNPVLIGTALSHNPDRWCESNTHAGDGTVTTEHRAETLMRLVVSEATETLAPTFDRTNGSAGWVCAQVNPRHAAERECMRAMARRIHAWASNVAVKLPTTRAGLDVLEDCIADGITVTATVSFTVPQVIAIAERHRAGIRRAVESGVTPGRCFAVIMIGRLDDYLRDVARDAGASLSEADIRQAGLAVAKRAYAIYTARGYETRLLVAALRGPYHLTELAGASLVMSIHPTYQGVFVSDNFPREPRIDCEVPADVIERLEQLPEFVRAYEPDGMTADEFASFGLTQRTLAQFVESGWNIMERHA